MWVDAINSACWVGWLSRAQIAELAGCTLKNMHKQPKTQVLVCGWERIWYISFTLFSLKVFSSIFRQIFCMMTNYRDGQDCSSRLKNELANIILWLCVHWGSALGGRWVSSPSGILVVLPQLERVCSKAWLYLCSSVGRVFFLSILVIKQETELCLNGL